MLTWSQPGHQHDPSVRELQRVVVGVRLLRIDLPETSHAVSEPAKTEARQQAPESVLVLGLTVEHYFRTGKKADSHIWLSDGCEAAGTGPGKAGRGQLVSDLGGTGCDAVQTIVTH